MGIGIGIGTEASGLGNVQRGPLGRIRDGVGGGGMVGSARGQPRRTAADVGGGIGGELARGTASGRGGRASAWVGGSAGAGRGQEIEEGSYPNQPPRTRFC